jgi:hypothetical protein
MLLFGGAQHGGAHHRVSLCLHAGGHKLGDLAQRARGAVNADRQIVRCGESKLELRDPPLGIAGARRRVAQHEVSPAI